MTPPPSRKPRARTYDPARTRAALDAEVGAVREAVRVMCAAPDAAELLRAPSGLEGWTVRNLIVHIAVCLDTLPRALSRGAGSGAGPAGAVDLDLQGYVSSMLAWGESMADSVAEAAVRESRELPGDGGPEEVLARFDAAAGRLAEAVAGTPGSTPVPLRMSTMTVDDFLVTRLLETVVHGEDLTAATGTAVAHDRQALAAVVRLTADALAARAPGGSVEVRIPPFAVVQCVEGPRHTRGTPPNVVETRPLTWIRLATGRMPWAEAVDAAEVSASGERADLSGLLPLLG